jgi:hypothetical protein
MTPDVSFHDGFEISPRFRRTIEDRIAKLERDAEYDDEQIARLDSHDHIRRQLRLIAVQRSEALRMRLFLDRAKTRVPRPFIALDNSSSSREREIL